LLEQRSTGEVPTTEAAVVDDAQLLGDGGVGFAE